MDEQEKMIDKAGVFQTPKRENFNIALEEIAKILQNDEQQVTLGLDFGTQYCYAGYIYKNEFNSFLPNAQDTAGYGVPTAIAYKHTGVPETTYLYGIDATNMINTYGSGSIKQANAGEKYYLWQKSIKTLVRENERQYTPTDSTGERITFDVIYNLQGFLSHFFTSVDYNDLEKKKIKINKIVLAYPNIAKDIDYQGLLKKALNDVIVSLKDEKKYFEIQSANDGKKFIDIQIKSEGSLAVNAIVKKFKEANVGDSGDSFMTVDVGGGTIDYAYFQVGQGNRGEEKDWTKAISKDDWAIKTKIDDGLLKEWLCSSNHGIRTALKLAYFAKNKKTHASITRKDNRSCDNECKDCREHDDELKKIKGELKNNMYSAIKELLGCGTDHMLQPVNVCLLGGGSHMIFIQEALKKAFSEFNELNYNDIQYWTLTPTKGEGYNVVYKQEGENVNEKNITTANFLAYAAALYGEQQRAKREKTKSAEAGDYGRQAESATVYTGEWATEVIELDNATYVFEVELNDGSKRYIMLPERKYNDQNAYILVPKPIIIGCNGQAIYNNIKILPRENKAGQKGEEYITVNESDLKGLSCQNIGPEKIPNGMAFAVGIKFNNNYLNSDDDKKLQIYLYQSAGQYQGRYAWPKDEATPYFAADELTEERRRQLKGAGYNLDLTFRDFMELSGQNLKC